MACLSRHVVSAPVTRRGVFRTPSDRRLRASGPWTRKIARALPLRRTVYCDHDRGVARILAAMTGDSPNARPIVFLGPSIRESDARQVLDADYRAPIRRGD